MSIFSKMLCTRISDGILQRIYSYTFQLTTSQTRSVISLKEIIAAALKQLILTHPNGLKEEQKLRVCYRGLEQDLEQLKQEGWVRSITTGRKEIVLFPINLNDKEIEVRQKYQKKTLGILSEIWDKEVCYFIVYLFSFQRLKTSNMIQYSLTTIC